MSQSGKTAVVTGSNTGLGFETAFDLYRKGARVHIACRSEEKGLDAIERMKAQGGAGELVFSAVDLASLRSVKAFTDAILATESRLDLLVNNAGVMIPPPSKTEDGYESQFGVNFVGHFALTGQLFDLLEATKGSRVVTLSSLAHVGASIDFGNFRLEKPYDKWREYGQSKLADLIFALEFDQRLRNNGNRITSLAAHPGFTSTDLQRHIDQKLLTSVETMTPEEGARSTLTACLSEDAQGGQYWGPDGAGERLGNPAQARIDPVALDADLNARLWD